VCVCVCMFGHNSETPVAISAKLGTHMAVCMFKNLTYILYRVFHDFRAYLQEVIS
jgi:hypothetical protein